MMNIARGRICFTVSHKDPYSVLYYFNIHLCDLERKESVISALKTSSSLLFGQFNNKFMKANSDKSHLITSYTEATAAMFDGLPIDSSEAEVLLVITIDHELKFDDHVNDSCKKACLKLNALVRIAPFMNVSKKRIIIKSFTESQFGYCPLIWMFHGRGLNNKINRTHERALESHIMINHHHTKNYSLKIDLQQYTIET